MDAILLIKLGELTLKGGNRKVFEERLKLDIKKRLKTASKIVSRDGRFYLHVDGDHLSAAKSVLSSVPGLTGYAQVAACAKTIDSVCAAAVEAAKSSLCAGKTGTFKVEARRADKSFPLDSHGIAVEAGAKILDAVPGLSVNVHNPDFVITVEIRERAYVYSAEFRGERGLPTGTLGKGILLLSGGIDSPVAGYLMAKRGLLLEAVYFNAYPFTSEEARLKVIALARMVAKVSGPIRLHTVPFTEAQVLIKKTQSEDSRTIMLRACMMRAAGIIAGETGANCLITGESLGQVASQTVENIRVTGAVTDLPVWRPLIGIDKEDTVEIAKRIGTYGISILPYEDCCVLFSPKHPVIRADYESTLAAFRSMDADAVIAEAVRARTVEYIEYLHE